MKTQFTGRPVEFPASGVGPHITKNTYEINSASGLFNWNPHQIALVSYFDPNYDSSVTKAFVIGGTHGPTNISISTGSYRSGSYTGATEILVLENTILPGIPFEGLFPGSIREFVRHYGHAGDIANGLGSSSTYSVRLVDSDPTSLFPNVTYDPGFLREKGVDFNALYKSQGLDYPFTSGYQSIAGVRGQYTDQDHYFQTTRTVADVIGESFSRNLREIGSSVFGGWGTTTAAPMLGEPFNEAGGSPGYRPSTAQRMRAGR